MLRDSTVVVVAVVRTRPRATPLAMITMGKSTHGFLLFSIYVMLMGLRYKQLVSNHLLSPGLTSKYHNWLSLDLIKIGIASTSA